MGNMAEVLEQQPGSSEAQATLRKAGWKRGICGICPAGCWVEIALENGRLVDIRKDDSHPLGMICRRGEHAPEIVYSEHRLRHPLKRVGAKGTHEFTRISWDQAYDAITENLTRIKAESGPEAVAIYTGRGAFELSLCDLFQPKGVAVSSASNVLFPFGSPNTMGGGALCYVSFAMIAPHVTMGRMLINMFTDMENAELLVVWGTNPATDSPPLDMHRLEAAARRGAKVVVIDPRRTETVTRCRAEWIPIRPGTDGALALSMIGVMIDEELHDEPFVENWCHGFDALKRYAEHFPPEVAAEITGVPAEAIRDVARRICAASGACPVMYSGLEYSNSGVQAIRAALTLFALAGHLDVPGGIGLAMADSHFPVNRSCNQPNVHMDRAVGADKVPIYTLYRHEPHASRLVPSVLKGDPYPIRSLIIHGSHLLTAWPQVPVWRAVLEKLDFLVCIDRTLTADAAYADIVLPATTMFEIDSYMTYGPVFRLREKVIEPVGEARNDYLIMAELARRLGYGHLYPQTEEAMIHFVLEGSGFTLEDVREAGGWVKIATPMMEYKKWEKGSLRPDGRPGFDTPTGKFEIWSTVLEEYGHEPLPKYIEPSEGPRRRPELLEKFPLVFNSGARPHTDFHSQHHGIPGLVKDHPEPTVEINAQDAGARGIRSGDLVQVRTARGAVLFRARVTEDIVQGAIECNQGGGTPIGPKAWQEWNVNELTDNDNFDEISGFPVYKALLCDVAKVEEGTDATRREADRNVSMSEPCLLHPQGERKAAKNRIYLDNAATTRVADAVCEAMLPYLGVRYGNPSSIHDVGRDAREAIEGARRQVARLINARPRRIIFTGSGSEANNLALKGIVLAREGLDQHMITSSIEHPCILQTGYFLENRGYRVTYLGVDPYGLVQPDTLRGALTDETSLVSIMLANNEVGTLQPIKALCAIAHEHGALVHCDAVQAIGKIKVDVEELGVDLLTVSGHKFHGPKGVGALFVRKGLDLEPLIHGGRQEGGLRAGTENVPAIVGLGKAAELALIALERSEETRVLRDRLEGGIRRLIPQARLNGHPEQRLPNILNLTLPGLRGESVVVAMDLHGVSLSSGSACKAGSPEPTHVLIAMGKSVDDAHCSVRFSLSHDITEADIHDTVAALENVLTEMESTVRFLPCK
jgi:cysteine desulfurase NifS